MSTSFYLRGLSWSVKFRRMVKIDNKDDLRKKIHILFLNFKKKRLLKYKNNGENFNALH